MSWSHFAGQEGRKFSGNCFFEIFQRIEGCMAFSHTDFFGKGQSRITVNCDNFWTGARCTEANHAVLFWIKRKGAYLPFWKGPGGIAAVKDARHV